MFKWLRRDKPEDLEITFEGFMEIGATGPQRLQFVVASDGRKVTMKLTAEEARWLANALTYWADSSETIQIQ